MATTHKKIVTIKWTTRAANYVYLARIRGQNPPPMVPAKATALLIEAALADGFAGGELEISSSFARTDQPDRTVMFAGHAESLPKVHW